MVSYRQLIWDYINAKAIGNRLKESIYSIARNIGCSPSNVSRTLKKFEDEGLIKIEYGKYNAEANTIIILKPKLTEDEEAERLLVEVRILLQKIDDYFEKIRRLRR